MIDPQIQFAARSWTRTCVRLAIALSAVVGGCGRDAGEGSAAEKPRAMETAAIWGSPGMVPGEFTTPRAIALADVGGRLKAWIVDKGGRIQRFDAERGVCESWWRLPNCENGKPTGLTVGPAPEGLEVAAGTPVLYVAHTHAHKVMMYEIGGGSQGGARAGSDAGSAAARLITPSVAEEPPRMLGEWGRFGRGPGEFVYPTDVAVLTDGAGRVDRYYVGEYGENDRVSVFAADRTFLFSFGTYGASASAGNVQFDRPQSIDIDEARREVVVADSRNHRIGRFTLEGKLIGWIGSPETSGPGREQWRYPWGLTLMGDGTALVVEFGNNRLHRVDLQTGATVGTMGRAGRGNGEFAQPWALAVSGGRVFVVDAGNHRVQVGEVRSNE